MSNKENKHTLLKVLGVTAVAGASAYAGAGYYVLRNSMLDDNPLMGVFLIHDT